MEEKNEFNVEVKKGKYFNNEDQYYVEFDYASDEQKKKIYEAFENGLIPGYGANSSRAREGKECIMPYLVDENGEMTTEDTGIIGGTSIPKDLLPEFIKRFVELDKATVSIGKEKMQGKFDVDKFEKDIMQIEGKDMEIKTISMKATITNAINEKIGLEGVQKADNMEKNEMREKQKEGVTRDD